MITVNAGTIDLLIGKPCKLIAFDEYDGHGLEDYADEWLGSEILITSDYGTVLIDGESHVLAFGFKVELLNSDKNLEVSDTTGAQ